ncbi:MAG: elongation factor P, partial [Clostridia bacterium]|nr:elongation factor P [Clostridia bacterium]
GKGAAFVRTKYKDVVSGATREASFNPTAKFETVQVERRELQYLYNDGELYYFMDMESYEQIPVDSHKLGDNFKFVKENEMCKLSSIKGEVFAVDPPTFVDLYITETEPGVRGDTATNVTKAATLETGAVVRVPIFINEGDLIRIDTRVGEYLERVNNK